MSWLYQMYYAEYVVTGSHKALKQMLNNVDEDGDNPPPDARYIAITASRFTGKE